MKKAIFSIFVFAIISLLAAPRKADNGFPRSADTTGSAHANSGRPFVFMENLGQVLDREGRSRPDVLFLAQSGGKKVAIRPAGIFCQFERQRSTNPFKRWMEPRPARHARKSMKTKTWKAIAWTCILAAQIHHRMSYLRRMEPNYENYFNIPTAPEGIVGVKSFSRIRLKGVYPRID